MTKTSLKIRLPYDREAMKKEMLGLSKTHQSFKDECNINFMMAQYQHTGQIKANQKQPQYLDLSNATDYQNALNLTMEAQDAFKQLPAKVRREFDNDPALFLQAVHEGTHKELFKEAGLLTETVKVSIPIDPETAPPPTAE